MRAKTKTAEHGAFVRGLSGVQKIGNAEPDHLAMLKQQALVMGRLVTRLDWEHVFPVRRWKTIGPHRTIACVGWWHRLRWRRWKLWQRMVEEARPVGYDIRLGVCLW